MRNRIVSVLSAALLLSLMACEDPTPEPTPTPTPTMDDLMLSTLSAISFRLSEVLDLLDNHERRLAGLEATMQGESLDDGLKEQVNQLRREACSYYGLGATGRPNWCYDYR